ncbi:unnamed protein product, partial [Prorocentrum cordatum]
PKVHARSLAPPVPPAWKRPRHSRAAGSIHYESSRRRPLAVLPPGGGALRRLRARYGPREGSLGGTASGAGSVVVPGAVPLASPPPVLARAVGRAAGPRPWRRSCAGASRSPFEVLGLEASATQADVKRAYFELSKKCHPDVYDAPDALERFQEIGRAYTMLIDEELRRSYEAQAGIYQQGETSFQDLFDRIFRDKRLKDPSLAVEERALYAITEARKGNETPMRDFVVDYRLPPQLFLPPNPVLEARPGGGGGDEDLADDGTRNTINDLLSKSPISGGG